MKLRTKRLTGTVEVDGIKVEFQQPTPQESRLIRIKNSGVDEEGQPTFDEVSYSADMFDLSVLEWEGAEDEGGNPLECTTENKAMVCEFDVAWSTKVAEAINKKIATRKDAVSKN